MKDKRTKQPLRLSNVVKKVAPEAKTTTDRLIASIPKLALDPFGKDDIGYMHSVLCQTCLPYREAKGVTLWERKQGNASLVIQSVQMRNPKTGDYEHIGLPFGTKARLILSYINTEAIINKSSRIYVQDNMTRFIKTLGLSVHGKSVSATKEQLRRLAAANISLSYADDNQYFEDRTQIIKRMNLWFPKDENQKVMWESYIDLSEDYFQSLMEHAIPMDLRAMASISNNAMALDVYSWLCQRLHRISEKEGNFVHWQGLKDQFGFNYSSMKKFKQVFRDTLKKVVAIYPDCRNSILEIDNKGYQLYHAKPPITKSSHLITKTGG